MSTPTPRTKPIDLSKCEVGQRVKLRNKLVVIFTGKSTCSRFPFKYEHPDHGEVTVTTGGQVLTSCAAPEDIVALLPLPKKAGKPGKKKVDNYNLDKLRRLIADFEAGRDVFTKEINRLKVLLKP